MRTLNLMCTVAAMLLPTLALTGCADGESPESETDADRIVDDEQGESGRSMPTADRSVPINGGAQHGSSGRTESVPSVAPFQAEPPSNDTCGTAEQHGIQPGTSLSLRGTTLGAADDYETFCADDVLGISYPDVVYALNVVSECTLRVVVRPIDPESGFDGVISYRTACEQDFVCIDATSDGVETLTGAVPGGSVQYVIISNAGAGDGAFDLDITCEAPACGDGMLNAGEACDDGGSVGGDGCDAACQLEVADPLTDSCGGAASGTAIAIALEQTKQIPSIAAEVRSTINATDSGTGSCMLSPDPDNGFFGSPDHIYRITPTDSGELTIRLGNDAQGVPVCGVDLGVEPEYPYVAGCYDRAIHVRKSDCGDALMEVACADSQVSWWSPEEVSFAVIAGSDYYVFVDGWLSFGEGVESYDVGSYVLELELN